jgi:fumarate reductase subunit D
VTQGRLPFIQGLQLSSWEFRFVLLGIAGQVNNMVSGIVVNFVSIYFPSLTAQLDLTQLFKGFWISWLIAFIILILILFCMNELLYRREKKLSP